MDINLYVLMTYAVTALISFAVIAVIVLINKVMNSRNKRDSGRQG